VPADLANIRGSLALAAGPLRGTVSSIIETDVERRPVRNKKKQESYVNPYRMWEQQARRFSPRPVVFPLHCILLLALLALITSVQSTRSDHHRLRRSPRNPSPQEPHIPRDHSLLIDTHLTSSPSHTFLIPSTTTPTMSYRSPPPLSIDFSSPRPPMPSRTFSASTSSSRSSALDRPSDRDHDRDRSHGSRDPSTSASSSAANLQRVPTNHSTYSYNAASHSPRFGDLPLSPPASSVPKIGGGAGTMGRSASNDSRTIESTWDDVDKLGYSYSLRVA